METKLIKTSRGPGSILQYSLHQSIQFHRLCGASHPSLMLLFISSSVFTSWFLNNKTTSICRISCFLLVKSKIYNFGEFSLTHLKIDLNFDFKKRKSELVRYISNLNVLQNFKFDPVLKIEPIFQSSLNPLYIWVFFITITYQCSNWSSYKTWKWNFCILNLSL